MNILNQKVDAYLKDGCGRCKFFATPKCKVNNWRTELEMLRSILHKSKLTEEIKWGSPCYTWEGKNVIMIAAFKESCVLSFFKGALLKDPYHILEKPGENSNTFRLFRFKDSKKITTLKTKILAYINEAIELEKSGAKIERKNTPIKLPVELTQKFKEDPILKDAFQKLTPGRQRSYILFISAAKQSATRSGRIEKYRNMILSGKDVNGR